MAMSAAACNQLPPPFAGRDSVARADREAPFYPPDINPGRPYDRRGYFPTTEDLTPAPRVKTGDPLHYFTNNKMVMIRRPADYSPEDVPRVAIWWTDNDGFHWQLAGYFGRQREFFPFDVEEDGDYGIRFVGPGQTPAMNTPANPDRVYHVDTQAPTVQIAVQPEQDWYHAGQTVTISWRADDYHLTDHPACVKMLVDFAAGEPRTIELQRDLAGRGSIEYRIPPGLRDHEIRFRVDTQDRAGNLGMIYSHAFQVVEQTVADAGQVYERVAGAGEVYERVAGAGEIDERLGSAGEMDETVAGADDAAQTVADVDKLEGADGDTADDDAVADAAALEETVVRSTAAVETTLVGPTGPEGVLARAEEPATDLSAVEESTAVVSETANPMASTGDAHDPIPNAGDTHDLIPKAGDSTTANEPAGEADHLVESSAARRPADAAPEVNVPPITLPAGKVSNPGPGVERQGAERPSPHYGTGLAPGSPHRPEAEAGGDHGRARIPFASAVARLPIPDDRLSWDGPTASASPIGRASDYQPSGEIAPDVNVAVPADSPNEASSDMTRARDPVQEIPEPDDGPAPPTTFQQAAESPVFPPQQDVDQEYAAREDPEAPVRGAVSIMDPTYGNGLLVPMPATVRPEVSTDRLASAHPWRILGQMLSPSLRTVWVLPRSPFSYGLSRMLQGRLVADHPAMRPVSEPGFVSRAIAGLPDDTVEIDAALLP
jgi:hypothetical protein